MTSFTPRSNADINADLSVALTPSSNGRFLVRHLARDDPFFYLGDTAWELFHRLSEAEAETFLRNRADKGFNSIMVVILAEHGGLDYPNRFGEWPFYPKSTSTAEKYEPDLSRPNPGYFDFVDKMVALASKLDMTISLVPTWGRYVNGGYYGSPVLFDADSAFAFGKFVGERYPFHPFILGADSVRYWHPDVLKTLGSGGDLSKLEVVDYGPVTEAMARGLIQGEKDAIAVLDAELRRKAEGYETLITFHSAQMWLPSAPEASSSAQFPDAEWLTLDCVQTGHHDMGKPSATPDEGEAGGAAQSGFGAVEMWKARNSYIPIRKMYATPRPNGHPRPVIDLEPHYENIHEMFDPNGHKWVAQDIRNGLWQGVLAGACGYTYGVNSIWQMHNGSSKTHPPIAPPTTATTDWFLEIDLPGSFNASVARKIMLTLPNPYTRVPDQSIVLSDTHEPGAEGEVAGDKLVSASRGEGWAFVHLPYGGNVEVDLGRALGGGEGKAWRAWWIDPKTGGRELSQTGSLPVEEQGGKEFKAPSEGSLNDDWLLYIELTA